MTRSRRWRKATLATFLGWVSGFAATSPFQIAEVLRNSGPNFQLLFSALGYGFAVWLLITLAGVAIVWACAVLPIALFVSELWLLARSPWVIAGSIGASLLAVSYKVHVWTHFYHDGIGLTNFWIYACFATVFSGVTAYYYLRFLAHEQTT
jgi:hypothetical protein